MKTLRVIVSPFTQPGFAQVARPEQSGGQTAI